jgi:hypothetical protein
LGGLVAGLIGVWTANRRRNQDAMDEFGVFIQRTIADLPERGVNDFYRETRPSIHEAIRKFWHFLKPNQRTKIDEIWKQYASITNEELDPNHEGPKGERMKRACQFAKAPDEFRSPHDIVKNYLDKFYALTET